MEIRKSYFKIISLSLVLLFMPFLSISEASSPAESINSEKKVQVQKDYGRIPLYFIENKGQVDEQVKFFEKSQGHNTFFTMDGIYISLKSNQDEISTNTHNQAIKLIPLGMNKEVEISAQEPQQAKVNYFIGNDPEKWNTNVPTYKAVLYKDAYPGIDLKFYGTNQQMEYDIIVKPGIDPSTMKFQYEGIEGLDINGEGDLVIMLKDGGEIIQKKPYVYQEIEGERVEIAGKFNILNSQDNDYIYCFELAPFDVDHSMIIDPVLVYSTYLGGSNDEYAGGIAVDSSGNAYVIGSTNSPDFPIDSPVQSNLKGSTDVFVTKLNAYGTDLIYSSYIGGTTYDRGNGIAVDSYGNAYVTGWTDSSDFPTTATPFQGDLSGDGDAFVTKLNSDGSDLIYSTYLGGSSFESGDAIAVDSSGNAYVIGETYSQDFPTDNPFQSNISGDKDAFVTKFTFDGSDLIYSTYLGGSGFEYSGEIAVDSSGNAYVIGSTESSDFPTANPFQENNGGRDAFISKLDADGSNLVYSSYLGGIDQDNGSSIAVDSSGNAYMTGYTGSYDFPMANPFQSDSGGGDDAFVTKLSSDGTALVYSTYLGGVGPDEGHGIAVDSSGNAYVIGETYAQDFPMANPFQDKYGGYTDVFVTKFSPDGSDLIYSTYLGGSSTEIGYGIAVDSSSNAYVTGNVAYSSGFPCTTVPFQRNLAGGTDIFITKLAESDNTPPEVFSTTPANNAINVALDTEISVVYSEWIKDIPATSFIFNDGTSNIDGNYAMYVWGPNMESNEEYFCPFSPLEYNKTYTVTISAGVEDLYGNATESEYTWSFSTLTIDTHIITATANIGGTISPSGDVIAYEGLDKTFNIAPNTGYYIKDVKVDGSSVGAVSSYTFEDVTEGHTIQATFAIYKYTINAAVGGTGGSIAPSGDVIVNHGSDQEFILTPAEGYAIDSVYVDGSYVGADDSYVFTNVTSNHTIRATFIINFQAYTSLSLDLSTQTILNDGTIDASGKMTRLPDIGANLSGLDIDLIVTAPGDNVSTYSTVTYDTLGHFRFKGVSGFSQKGVYQVQASFEGTNFYYNSMSPVKTVLVGASAGYAVIVEGKIKDGQGIDSHNKTANRIYARLKERGFLDDNIMYFNYDRTQTGVVVDDTPTKSAIANAITVWAKGKMKDSPAPLWIIMVDHGDTDTFYLGNESITPSELDTWLNTLEDSLIEDALAEKRIIIIGACYSGSFISALSGDGRVIVSSAAEDEASYKGSMEPDGIRSGEFFLEEFFQELERGESLKDSFEEATDSTEEFTRKGGGSANVNQFPYFDDAVQHPLLDDNGDSAGSNVLSGGEDDGYISGDIYLGVGLNYDVNSADNPAEIVEVTETLFLGTGDSSAQIWARSNDDSQVSSAWMEIRSPSMSLSPGSGTSQLELDIPNELMTLNEGLSRWEETYNSFSESGMYEVYYYASDVETGGVSPMKRSAVYKAKAGNKLPGSFDLLTPDNGEDTETVLVLMWTASTDPEKDPVTYTVEISEDSEFDTIVYTAGGITSNYCYISPEAGLKDLTTYYWRVIAVDQYGASTYSSERSFNTDNTNGLPGFLTGVVVNTLGHGIFGAGVATTGASTTTFNNGLYMMPLPSGTYTVNVTATGYNPASKSEVKVVSEEEVLRNFVMIPQTDFDGDGEDNNIDTDDDDDGMPDEWEEQYGIDPLFDEADDDPDGDGYTNLQEYKEGGDPNDPDSPFPWELFYPAITGR